MDRDEVEYERCSLRWKGMKKRKFGCVGRQTNKSNAAAKRTRFTIQESIFGESSESSTNFASSSSG